MRYDSKKRFAVEIGLGHYYFRNDLSEKITDESVFDDWYFDHKYDHFVNNYEFEVNLQFDVTCKSFKTCAFLKNVESNIGLSVIRTLSHVKYNRLYEGGHWDVVPLTYTSGSYNEFGMYTGLSHTLKYNVSSKFYITSKVSVLIDPFNTFSEYYRNNQGRLAHTSLQIGAGYNF